MSATGTVESAEGICEVERLGPTEAPARYLIEIPHGATEEIHFDALAARLEGAYPDDLKAFFFVNTDVGAPECARRIARGLAACGAGVLVVRGLIPRTFIDCNRLSEPRPSGTEMTPAMPDYVDDERDVRLLSGLYDRYQELSRSAYAEVCGAGGLALTLHTYAPRSVDIDRIDGGIVEALRRAYEPEAYAAWERRPDVDLITEDTSGRRLAPVDAVESLKRHYAAIGVRVEENATYRLHFETLGYLHSAAYPGRVLCMEISRGLLADPFRPFVPMKIGRAKVKRMTDPIVGALSEMR